MIYARGSDSDLRQMCFDLIEAGLITDADLVDRASIRKNKKGIPKVGWSGKVVTIVCPRAKLKRVMRAMKKAYRGDDLVGHAMPVLTSL